MLVREPPQWSEEDEMTASGPTGHPAGHRPQLAELESLARRARIGLRPAGTGKHPRLEGDGRLV
jgi:hypothetical protein